MTEELPESDDPAVTLLAFAVATATMLGAALAGGFVMNEMLRRKEQQEVER